MQNHNINKLKLSLAILSGLLLTGSFPKISLSVLAWFALVPLFFSIQDLCPKKAFILGFTAGFVHNITLLYWLSDTMNKYGNIPLFLCVIILALACAFLSLYLGVFSAIISGFFSRPAICLFLIPVLWVSFEYMRFFLFPGFPWELLGYSQHNNPSLIQISDLSGVYGVSFLIALSNTTVFLAISCLLKKKCAEKNALKKTAVASITVFVFISAFVFFYGKWKIDFIDELAHSSSSIKAAVIQGNIDQSVKWNPDFQHFTIKKYTDLSLLSESDKPNLVVWPETATPFYFLYNISLSNSIIKTIKKTDSYFLIGSPSFTRKKEAVNYYNTAYLINPDGDVCGKYDKVRLVPFGEYIPFNKWLPFAGKIVEGIGDFKAGIKGKTVKWNHSSLGIQICYEIIFPDLSRAMVKNNANLLVNITNDAWFGSTSAPYQHFSMAIFRAVENRRALIRSANTGISGFIDPAGRVIKKTNLFKEATITHSIPLIQIKSFYTRFGDMFTFACIVASVICFVLKYVYNNKP